MGIITWRMGEPEYQGKPLTFVILAYTAPHWIALESLFCANHYIDILPKTFEMSTLIVPLWRKRISFLNISGWQFGTSTVKGAWLSRFSRCPVLGDFFRNEARRNLSKPSFDFLRWHFLMSRSWDKIWLHNTLKQKKKTRNHFVHTSEEKQCRRS